MSAERLNAWLWPAVRAGEQPGREAARAGGDTNTARLNFEAGTRILAIAVFSVWLISDDGKLPGIWLNAAQAPEGEPASAVGSQGGLDQSAPAPATPPAKEFVVGAYTGAPYTYPSKVTVKKTGQHDFVAKDVQWRGEPFDNPIYYGIRVQRWFEGGRTGAMLDFTHSKALGEKEKPVKFEGLFNGEPINATKNLGEVFRRLEFSHGHNMLTLNGLMRLPDLHARLSPYVGLGLGINLPHSEIRLKEGGRRTYEYQYAGPVAQGLIGIEFRVPRMSYFFEYKFTLAAYSVPLSELDGTEIGLFADLYRQFSNWLSGEEPPGGSLSTRLTSHQLIGGLGVRFGVPKAAAQ